MELVLFVSGGAMRGVFSAGALEVLAELGLRERVAAVYGVSAGAFNAGLFATGTTTSAPRWYCDVAPRGNIIQTTSAIDVLRGRQALDMAEAERLMEEQCFLNVEDLMATPFPVYFGVVDAETKDLHYLDARRADALRVLRASATLVPFVREPVAIDGRQYIDGGFRDAIGIPHLSKRHPNARFIVLLNNRFDARSIQQLLGILILYAHDRALAAAYRENLIAVENELATVEKLPNVLVIKPPVDYPVTVATTDIPTLERGYAMGREAVLSQLDAVTAFCEVTQPVRLAK